MTFRMIEPDPERVGKLGTALLDAIAATPPDRSEAVCEAVAALATVLAHVLIGNAVMLGPVGGASTESARAFFDDTLDKTMQLLLEDKTYG